MEFEGEVAEAAGALIQHDHRYMTEGMMGSSIGLGSDRIDPSIGNICSNDGVIDDLIRMASLMETEKLLELLPCHLQYHSSLLRHEPNRGHRL
jgi:hypothetical protein